MSSPDLSIIIPAHQEADRIAACLAALRNQDPGPGRKVEAIVVANGCTDDTASVAQSQIEPWRVRGHVLRVIETPAGGKTKALNLGEAAATGRLRLYLDADVVAGPGMLAGLIEVLDGPGARYAGARLRIPRPRSPVSRLYARFWQKLPFVAQGVTGAGLFAVNAEGRARWEKFPQVISDDGFARLHFAPHERRLVEVPYDWPITDGAVALVRVRRRQDAGMAELSRLYPALMANGMGDRPGAFALLRLAADDPLGFAAYAGISLAVRLAPRAKGWARGR